MDKINRNRKFVIYVKGTIIFILLSFFGWIISNENLIDYVILTGLPIQNIDKLLTIHLIVNSLLFLSILFLGVLLIKLYYKLYKKDLPFVGFLWIFGVFKLCMSMIFLMNIINLWRSYIWLDASIRVFATVFAVGAVVTFYNSFKQMVSMKSPREYGELKDELTRVLEIQEEVISTDVK